MNLLVVAEIFFILGIIGILVSSGLLFFYAKSIRFRFIQTIESILLSSILVGIFATILYTYAL